MINFYFKAINGSCWCYNAKVQLQHSYISTFGFTWRMFYKLCLSCKLMKPCILGLILSQGEILQWMNSSFIVVYSTLFEIVLYFIENMFQAILLFITFETTVTYLYFDWKGFKSYLGKCPIMKRNYESFQKTSILFR